MNSGFNLHKYNRTIIVAMAMVSGVATAYLLKDNFTSGEIISIIGVYVAPAFHYISIKGVGYKPE